MTIAINFSSLNAVSYPTEKQKFREIDRIQQVDQDFSISTKPYILSNECNREKTMKVLTENPAPANGFHIGFSCWENFDIMAARGSCGAILADISTLAHKFHEITKELILASKDRHEFVERMVGFLKTYPEYPRDETLESIEVELKREGSWLSDDKSFAFIQSLYKEDRIFHVRMNITDRLAFDAISGWLLLNGLKCDSFYLTNIPDWIKSGDDSDKSMRLLKMAINRVIGRDTYIIHASEHFSEGSGMPQRVYQRFPYDPLLAMMEKI